MDKNRFTQYFLKYRYNLLELIYAGFYNSPMILLKEFGSLKKYKEFLFYVYLLCNGKHTVREISRRVKKNFASPPIAIVSSAIAMLSILRIISAKD